MRKILKNNGVEILVYVIIILFFLGFIGIYINTSNTEELTEVQRNCNHEFVTTTEFSFFSGTNYRVISKCVKCGYVIR